MLTYELLVQIFFLYRFQCDGITGTTDTLLISGAKASHPFPVTLYEGAAIGLAQNRCGAISTKNDVSSEHRLQYCSSSVKRDILKYYSNSSLRNGRQAEVQK